MSSVSWEGTIVYPPHFQSSFLSKQWIGLVLGDQNGHSLFSCKSLLLFLLSSVISHHVLIK